MLCKRKNVKIVEAEMCPDHVRMLVEIPPSISVSSFVGYLKGKSTLICIVDIIRLNGYNLYSIDKEAAMFEYMTAQEAAEFWGISVRRVQRETFRQAGKI